MLIREQNSILEAVQAAWGRTAAKEAADRKIKEKEIFDRFQMSDPRWRRLGDALIQMGATDPDAVIQAMLLDDIVATRKWPVFSPRFSGSGLRSDIAAELAALPAVRPSYCNGEASYNTLRVALSTSRMKWPELQPLLYVFMSEIASSASYQEASEAMERFALAMAAA